MTSHEIAERYKQLADWILSKPSFDLERENRTVFEIVNYYSKDKFIAAAKALGAGKKVYKDQDFEFIPDGQPQGVEFSIQARRSTVCRLVTPAVYDCEPFLKPEEESQIGAA